MLTPVYLSHSGDIRQFQREPVGLRCLGLPPFSLVSQGNHQVSQKGFQVDSDPSKSSWGPSPQFTLITRFAYGPRLRGFFVEPIMQEIVAVRNIEGLLSRITALEALFAKRPGDVEEQRRRNDLIRYVVIPPSRPGVDFSPAGSEASKGSCGPSLSSSLNMFEMMKRSVGSSRTFGKL